MLMVCRPGKHHSEHYTNSIHTLYNIQGAINFYICLLQSVIVRIKNFLNQFNHPQKKSILLYVPHCFWRTYNHTLSTYMHVHTILTSAHLHIVLIQVSNLDYVSISGSISAFT